MISFEYNHEVLENEEHLNFRTLVNKSQCRGCKNSIKLKFHFHFPKIILGFCQIGIKAKCEPLVEELLIKSLPTQNSRSLAQVKYFKTFIDDWMI